MNFFMLGVGLLQFCASAQCFWQGDWRMGTMNLCVGIANAVLGTGAKG